MTAAFDLLGAIDDDDKLLDLLGSATVTDHDDWLCRRLLAMRAAAEANPMPELVDTDTAVAVIAYSASRRSVGLRSAIAAALLIVAVFLLLGLLLSSLADWWWMIPASGILGMTGPYIVAATMKPGTEWSTAGLTGDGRPVR